MIDLDNIESDQAYEAISYAWGESTERETIVCDEKPLSVTKSLFEALQVFRQSEYGNPRALWADGVCINQTDTQERNHQVKLMRRIYTTASKVLIWLGHESPEIVEAGLDLICQTAAESATEKGKKQPEEAIGSFQALPEPQYILRDIRTKTPRVKVPPRTVSVSHKLQVLCPLFECQWFSRLWIVQELVLSRTAEVYWGLGSIDFVLVGIIALHIFKHHKLTFLEYSAYPGLRKCSILQNLWTRAWVGTTFFEMLVFTRQLGVSDPRDKVFGLLGLSARDSEPESSVFIEPNYSLSTVEVYTIVARKILVQQKEVDLLIAVQHGPHISDTCISWVPDWTAHFTNYLSMSARKIRTDVVPVVSIPCCLACEDLSPNSTVSVRGITIDTVRDLTDDTFNTVTSWSYANFARSLQAIIRSYQGLYDEATLAYTLSGGYTLDGYIVEDAEAYIAEYRAFATWDLEQYLGADSLIRAPMATEGESVSAAYLFYCNCARTVSGRRFFVTRDGMIGIGPLAAEEGDIVVVLFGGSVPFILRPYGDGQHYRVVGECYVHDLMDGQGIDRWRKSGKPAIDFHLF